MPGKGRSLAMFPFRPKMQLSPFQREKLEYYFKFFDADGSGTLEKKDLGVMMKRILEFTGWSPDSSQAHATAEVHETFFEVLFERADEDKNEEIDVEEWLHLWEKLLPGCMGMHNFPVWLRLLPKTLFKIIDRNEDNEIDEVELMDFYVDMIGLSPDVAKREARKAWDQMTDFGDYALDINSYEQCFANFLIGKTPFGPGRYIFGCFSNKEPKFALIQQAIEDDKDIKATRRRGSYQKGVDPPRVRRQALQ